jgi:hypothetical protein
MTDSQTDPRNRPCARAALDYLDAGLWPTPLYPAGWGDGPLGESCGIDLVLGFDRKHGSPKTSRCAVKRPRMESSV